MRRTAMGISAAAAALAAGLFPSDSRAQGSWDATLHIEPFPSPYYSDWDIDPNMGSLTVMNHTSSADDVQIVFTITDRTNRVLARGTSEPEVIAAGAVAIYDSPYEIAGSGTHDEELERVAARTGRLPEGDYTACAAAADLSGFVLAEACADFFIAYPDPPLLLGPENGVALTEEAPLFQWSPVQVPVEYQLAYVLRIVELLPGQLPGEALASNIPVYEERDAFGTAVRYPIDALPLEAGKTYAWSVRALDQNGYTASANEGRSEIWTFTVEDPDQPPVTSSAMTLAMSPGSDLGAGGGEPGSSLAGICMRWDQPPSFIDVPMNVLAAFATDRTESNATLYRDNATRAWAVITEGVGGNASYLLYGECGGVGGPGGLQWIARRAGSLADLGLPIDDEEDTEEEMDGLPAHELGWRYGVLILSLHSLKVGELPESFEAPQEFLEFKEIKVDPGVNVYAEVNLGNGPARTVLEALGHEDPYVSLQGFLGAGLQFSVGGTIGQGAPDSAGSTFESKTQAEVEATILSLTASLPERPPLFLGEWIESTQVSVKLDVKAKGEVGKEWHDPDGSWKPGLQVGTGLGFSLAVQSAEDTWLGGVERTATISFKKQLYKAGDTTSTVLSRDGLKAVIKLESDRELDRFAPIIFSSPETEVEVDLKRPFPGLDGVKVKVGGQVGTVSAPGLGKGSLELSWPTDKTTGSASGSQSRGDSIRANIARLEAEQESALDRGDTAEAERLGKQLDLERNALVSWELAGGEKSEEPSEPASRPGRSLHWEVEVQVGNMGLSEMLQLIGSAGRGDSR